MSNDGIEEIVGFAIEDRVRSTFQRRPSPCRLHFFLRATENDQTLVGEMLVEECSTG